MSPSPDQPCAIQYPYSQDLWALESCTSSSEPCLPTSLSHIRSPLVPSEWQRGLANHPDSAFTAYILQGIIEGFRIGFNRAHSLRPSKKNMSSARANPQVVMKYIEEEVQAGRLLQVPNAAGLQIQTSSFGVIPKRHQPGKWRLIVDLSSPTGSSVNDGVAEALCSIRYPTVHDGARLATRLGRGALLAKIDLKNAYRIIPVHPADRLLLGVNWQGQVYIDAALPFGLRLAPKIFTAVADALTWIMQCQGVDYVLHYLDDFLFVGAPDSPQCANSLSKALSICQQLGVPVAPHKIQGPATQLTFLGIELDTHLFQLRLPQDKLYTLRSEIRNWLRHRRCRKRDLQSLIGLLNHAASVIGPGRTFMRGLIDALHFASASHHWLRLNHTARADLHWWALFAEHWNGISFMPGPPPDLHVFSDASGGWGCGGVWEKRWFQLQWPPSWLEENMAVKELVPIVAAAALWGPYWQGKVILCFCDNMAVVAAINAGRAKFPPINRLLRCLFFLTAYFHCSVSAAHIQGTSNTLADAISRNLLFTHSSQVSPNPDSIPLQLHQLLLDKTLDKTSSHWKVLFNSFLTKALQHPLHGHTPQLINATSSFVPPST